MKRLLLVILTIIISTKSIAQNNTKDTLFFKYDKNYILFYEDYGKKFNSSYKDFEKEVLKNIHLTKTQGYFLLKKIDTLYSLTTPKEIYSLKDYVERKEFYISNRIIDIDYLKKELFNKYKIIIVTDNKYIEIRQNPHENFYNSYYPIKYADKVKYPKQMKDTLFIKYDSKLLSRKQHPLSKEFYFIIKDLDKKEDVVYFSEEEILYNLTPKKIYCLKKVLKKSNAYYGKNKFDDYALFDYFNKSKYDKIFLVKKKQFIKVGVIYEIE